MPRAGSRGGLPLPRRVPSRLRGGPAGPDLRVLQETVERGHPGVDDPGATVEDAELQDEAGEELPRDAQHVPPPEPLAARALPLGDDRRVAVHRPDVLVERAVLDVVERSAQPPRRRVDEQVLVHGEEVEPRALTTSESEHPVAPRASVSQTN